MIATIIVTITNMHGMIVLIGTSTATDPEAFSVASARLDHLQSSGIDAPIYNLSGPRSEGKPILIVARKLANLPDSAVFCLEPAR